MTGLKYSLVLSSGSDETKDGAAGQSAELRRALELERPICVLSDAHVQSVRLADNQFAG